MFLNLKKKKKKRKKKKRKKERKAFWIKIWHLSLTFLVSMCDQSANKQSQQSISTRRS